MFVRARERSLLAAWPGLEMIMLNMFPPSAFASILVRLATSGKLTRRILAGKLRTYTGICGSSAKVAEVTHCESR